MVTRCPNSFEGKSHNNLHNLYASMIKLIKLAGIESMGTNPNIFKTMVPTSNEVSLFMKSD